MKLSLYKFFTLSAFIIVVLNISAFGQNSSGLRNIQPDNTGEEKINKVIADAGDSFKQGLKNLQENRPQQARENFDKSVETFLISTINTHSSVKFQACYNQLIETIYRMEFPSERQQPQIKGLAVTCGWNIENELADGVAKIINAPKIKQNNVAVNTANDVNKDALQAVSAITQSGFGAEQKFEPSPLDELAKLELTPEEQNFVNTEEGQVEYQRIQLAVASGSLGLRFQMHPMVQQFVRYYQGRGRKTMETGLYRSGMFMRMARQIFRKEGIPENVAWLGQVESAWKPSALSWASASGLWQFIPGTGARYGLRRTAYIDERNGFERATQASAQYLKFLANRYNGNWELALAAYNSGEGNVDRAIRRAGAANFWSAYPFLPRETRNYVPNILATILIANNPNAYGFGHVRPAPQLQYELIRAHSSMSLGVVAQAADTTIDYIRYLNPELRTNMTPPEGYNIRVPMGRGNSVLAVIRKMPRGRNASNVTLTTALAGESIQNIANRQGISVEELRAMNGGAIKQGEKIVSKNLIKRTNYSSPSSSPVNVPVLRGVQIVKARAGDTVAKIAARYGIAAIEVAKFNGLTGAVNNPLPVGREIRIPAR